MRRSTPCGKNPGTSRVADTTEVFSPVYEAHKRGNAAKTVTTRRGGICKLSRGANNAVGHADRHVRTLRDGRKAHGDAFAPGAPIHLGCRVDNPEVGADRLNAQTGTQSGIDLIPHVLWLNWDS